MSFFYPKQNVALPLPLPEEKERTGFATLTDDEVIELVKKGEIKREDMTMAEKQRFDKYIPAWKQ